MMRMRELRWVKAKEEGDGKAAKKMGVNGLCINNTSEKDTEDRQNGQTRI